MAYREFTDGDGQAWRAWDTYPQNRGIVTAPYAEGWLCFESRGGKRRLSPIPPGWDELPGERLCVLLRAAGQVAPLRAESGTGLPLPDPIPLP